jgi:hypothetical protein
MRLEALDLWVVDQLDGRILDGAVRPFGLAVGPRMIRLSEPVFDAELDADAVENVRGKKPATGAMAVLGRRPTKPALPPVNDHSVGRPPKHKRRGL